jgi:hypothetical protein
MGRGSGVLLPCSAFVCETARLPRKHTAEDAPLADRMAVLESMDEVPLQSTAASVKRARSSVDMAADLGIRLV